MSTVPFLIAKAHANHSKSLTESQMNGMITAEKMSEVEMILQSTGYGHLLEEVRPSVSLHKFEVALRRDYAKLLSVYRSAAIGDVEKLLNAFTLSIEAENMDMIFQAIIRDNIDETLEEIIIPVGKFGLHHYRRIMETSADALIASDLIIYPELRKPVQQVLNQTDDPDERIFRLSAALSHTSYQKLYEVAPQWVKLEAEFLNLETICRAINMGISPQGWLIPNIGIVYKQQKQLMNYDNVTDVLNYMVNKFPIPRIIRNALDSKDPVARLEDEFLQYLYFTRYRDFSIFGNRKEAILDYFSIKLAEIEDISRVLTSKILTKTPRSELRRMIYPIYH